MGLLQVLGLQDPVVLVQMVAAGHDVLHLCLVFVLIGFGPSLFLSLTLTLSNCLGALKVDLPQDGLHRVLLLGVEHLLFRAHAL